VSYLTDRTIFVLKRHARPPFPAAWSAPQKEVSTTTDPVDLSRLQKADFVPALGY
jgi:hypothetical protein